MAPPHDGRPARFARRKQETIDSVEGFLAGQEAPAWPLEVFVEVSNLCDLRCAMCPTFSGLSPHRLQSMREQRRGFVSEETLAHLDSVLCHALIVHAFGYGEPTLHPGFGQLLRALERHEVMVDFFTHGMHLSEAMCELVVACAVGKVTVSLSGATRQCYEDVYLGGDFDRVLDGIRRLVRLRSQAPHGYPRVHVNSLAFRHHVDRLPDFVDVMADVGVDVIEVKKLVESVPAVSGHAAPLRPAREWRVLEAARRRAQRHGITLAAEQYERQAGAADTPRPSTAIGAFKEVPARVPHDGALPGIELETVNLLQRDGSDVQRALDFVPAAELLHTGDDFVCYEPFKTLYVRQGGSTKPCCFYPDRAPSMGQLGRHDADAIWQGAGYCAIRHGIAEDRYSRAGCGHCLSEGLAPPPGGMRDTVWQFAHWYRQVWGAAVSCVAAPEPSPVRVRGALMTRQRVAAQIREGLAQGRWNGQISGVIDGVSASEPRRVVGWVRTPAAADLRWRVSLWAKRSSRRLAVARADEFRADVKDAGHGDGCYGFSLMWPHGTPEQSLHDVRVRVDELDFDLPHTSSPRLRT